MQKQLKKIVWAIDAYQEPDHRIWKNSVAAIRALTKADRMQVTPVYVSLPNFPTSVLVSPYVQASATLRGDASDALAEKLKGLSIRGLGAPKVIAAREFSTTGEADALLEYARDEGGADLIVTGSHGRTRVARAFVGSFAESLLLRSDLPLLIVGGSVRLRRDFDHILFPTDFSEYGKPIFEHVLALAKQLGARITIMNVIQPPMIVPLSIASTRRSYNLLGSVKEEKARRQELAHQYAEMVERYGVEVDVLVRTSGAPVSETIRRSARALQVSLIAMAAHSGKISAMFAGSTARQVVRSAGCPVWLFHEKGFLRAQRRKAA